MFGCFMDAHQLFASEFVRETSHFTEISVLAGSAHEAQKTLPGVFVGSVRLLPEVYHQCLLARSSCVVVNEAIDTELIEEANSVITNSSVCLVDQAVDAFGKNVQVWLYGGDRHMAERSSFQGWYAFEQLSPSRSIQPRIGFCYYQRTLRNAGFGL
jgi:hypothetical protein